MKLFNNKYISKDVSTKIPKFLPTTNMMLMPDMSQMPTYSNFKSILNNIWLDFPAISLMFANLPLPPVRMLLLFEILIDLKSWYQVWSYVVPFDQLFEYFDALYKIKCFTVQASKLIQLLISTSN